MLRVYIYIYIYRLEKGEYYYEGKKGEGGEEHRKKKKRGYSHIFIYKKVRYREKKKGKEYDDVIMYDVIWGMEEIETFLIY